MGGNKKYLALFLTGRLGNAFNGRGLRDLAGRGWVIFVRYAKRLYREWGGKRWCGGVLRGKGRLDGGLIWVLFLVCG